MRMTVEQANREYASLLRGITLDRELGRSSFAVVYAATDTDGTECRIKIIRLPGTGDDLTSLREKALSEEEIRTRLEAAMRGIVAQTDRLRRLNVPTIMAIEDRRLVRGRSGELVLLVRCEPLTLFDDFARTHDITANDLINLGLAVCGALEAASAEGVIHGNLKPSNLFVAPDGTVCVADFAEEHLLGQALDTVPFDSLLYMPPEQQNDTASAAADDLYALGIVLYSLFNQRCVPFLGQPNVGEEELRRAIVQRREADELPPPVNADDGVADVIARACAADPARRYPSAAALADDLRSCLVPEEDDYVVLPAVDTITEILPLCSGEPAAGAIVPPAVGAAGVMGMAVPNETAAPEHEGDRFVAPGAAAGAFVGAYAGAAAYRSSNDAAIRAAQQSHAAEPAPAPQPVIPAAPYMADDAAEVAENSFYPNEQPAEDNFYADDDEADGGKENLRRLLLVAAAILALILLFVGVVWGIGRLTSLGEPADTGDCRPAVTTDDPTVTTEDPALTTDDPAVTTADPTVTVAPDVTTEAPTTTPAPETTAQQPIINETTAPTPASVKLPTLTGLDYNTAAAKLNALKIHIAKTEVYSDTVAAGKVISQSQAAGTSVPEGTTIALTVSRGPETFSVPVLVGLSRDEAEAKLAELSLTAKFSPKYDTAAVGTVLSQNPATGTKLTAGSAVTLVVSAGLENLEMPNFVGSTKTQAEELIRRHNLTNIAWQSVASAAYAKDTVYYQSLPVGRNINTDTPITLYISLGAENLTIPNVIGMDPDAAIAILKGCGYTVMPVYAAADVKQVLSTSPAAGESMGVGDWIKVIIGDPEGETALTLPRGDFAMGFAQTVSLRVEGAQGRKLVYSSSDTKVAVIDENGRITANAVGRTLITVTAEDGEAVSCYVNVEADNNLFAYTISGAGCIITGYNGTESDVTVPERINGVTVTAIGDRAFAGKPITAIHLPATVTSVGASAFENCTRLYSVNLPSSVSTIGSRAFLGCSVLMQIELPAGVVSLGASAFERCYVLEAVYLPATLTSIGDRAFRYCPAITLYLPDQSAALTYAKDNSMAYKIIG